MANKKAKKGSGKKQSSRVSTPSSEAPIAELDRSASGTVTRSGRKTSLPPHLRVDDEENDQGVVGMATGLSALATAASEATSRPSPSSVDTPFADITNGGTGGSSDGNFPKGGEEDDEDEEDDVDEDSSDDDLGKSSKTAKASNPLKCKYDKYMHYLLLKTALHEGDDPYESYHVPGTHDTKASFEAFINGPVKEKFNRFARSPPTSVEYMVSCKVTYHFIEASQLQKRFGMRYLKGSKQIRLPMEEFVQVPKIGFQKGSFLMNVAAAFKHYTNISAAGMSGMGSKAQQLEYLLETFGTGTTKTIKAKVSLQDKIVTIAKKMGNDAFLREVGRLACELLQKREDHYISHKIMCENEKTKKRSLKQENEDRRQEKLDTGNKKARISMKGVIGKMRCASSGAFDMSNAFGNEIFGADEDDLPSLADAPPEGSDVGNAAVPKDKTTEAKERGKENRLSRREEALQKTAHILADSMKESSKNPMNDAIAGLLAAVTAKMQVETARAQREEDEARERKERQAQQE